MTFATTRDGNAKANATAKALPIHAHIYASMYICMCLPLRFNDSQTVTIVVIMHEKLKNLTTSTSSIGNNCGNLSADVYLCSSQLCQGAGRGRKVEE